MMLLLLSDPEIRGLPNFSSVGSQGSCVQGEPLRAVQGSLSACHQDTPYLLSLRRRLRLSTDDDDDACFEEFCHSVTLSP